MATETETTGTPGQDDREQVVQTPEPGTPATDDRNAKSDEVENLKALLLAQKDKIEEANRVLRQAEQEAAAPMPAGPSSETDEAFNAWLGSNDPAAKAHLMAMQQLEYDRRERAIEAELLRLPPEKERAVRKHIEANPRKFGTVKVALDNLEAEELRKRNQELEQENQRLKQKPDDQVLNAPPTVGREYTAPSSTKNLTSAQWQSNMAQLDERIENGDRAAMEEKYRLQRERRAGKIGVQG